MAVLLIVCIVVLATTTAQQYDEVLYDPVPHSHAHRHKLAEAAKKALHDMLKNDPKMRKPEESAVPQSTGMAMRL